MLWLGVLLALVVTGIATRDRLTWTMEVMWVVAGLPLVAWTWPRFPMTRLLCWLLALHALVLIYGGYYTYAQTPLGLWVKDAFGLARNHYDRLGHLMQGFVPAILVRELLLRTSPLRRGRWLFVLVVCACLAFSAFFEMIEWWAALIWGGEADAFLATQGDVWDTQWDMFCALIGVVLSQLLLARRHDHQLGLSPRP
jgi:putative membrane protein